MIEDELITVVIDGQFPIINSKFDVLLLNVVETEKVTKTEKRDALVALERIVSQVNPGILIWLWANLRITKLICQSIQIWQLVV